MIDLVIIKRLISSNDPVIKHMVNKGYSMQECIILPNFAIFCKNSTDATYVTNVVKQLTNRMPLSDINDTDIANMVGSTSIATLTVYNHNSMLVKYYEKPGKSNTVPRCPELIRIPTISDVLNMIFGTDDTPAPTSKTVKSTKTTCDNSTVSSKTDSCTDEIPNVAIERVIYNDKATVMLFSDKTKSVAICDDEDEFNPVAGFAIALCKKLIGNDTFHELIQEYVREEYQRRNNSKTCCCNKSSCGCQCNDVIEYSELDFVDVPEPPASKAPAPKRASAKKPTHKIGAKPAVKTTKKKNT